MIQQFGPDNHSLLCKKLAAKDADLKKILTLYGNPPLWTRKQEFASLVHIILEQQVSLASAKAAFDKLKSRIGRITPTKLLLLSDNELKQCYFSRQKTVYVRELAQALLKKELKLSELKNLHDEAVREKLIKIKGVGNWTVDIYLMFALQRLDIFPIGDLAMVNAMKEIKSIPKNSSKEELLVIAESWRPYRTVAAHLLWHYYIKTRNIKI